MATLLAIKDAMQRLAGAYNPPRAERENRMRTWQAVLDDVVDSDLESAVTIYLKSDRNYYPRPGQLRAIALSAATKPGKVPNTTEFNAADGSCAICGAPVELLTPWGSPVPDSWAPPPMPEGLTTEQMFDWAAENVPDALIRSRARYGHRHDFEAHQRAGVATPDCRRTFIAPDRANS